MKKLNLNSTIKIRLNDYGKDIYYHHLDELNEWLKSKGAKPLERSFPKVDENGFSEFQLWYFMSIYGQHSANGCPEYWEDLNFYIDDEDLEEV